MSHVNKWMSQSVTEENHLATRSNQRRVGQPRKVSSANSDKNLQSGLNGWTRAANLRESPTLQVRDDRGKLRPALGTIASASALHSP
jgi:hypothetical protein